jgi:hypothetical protein
MLSGRWIGCASLASAGCEPCDKLAPSRAARKCGRTGWLRARCPHGDESPRPAVNGSRGEMAGADAGRPPPGKAAWGTVGPGPGTTAICLTPRGWARYTPPPHA